MEELLGRQAPHSAPAEQAVIGSMLIDPNCIAEVIDKVKSADFYLQANRDIFETMLGMFSYGQTVDPVTVLDQMRVRGVYKEDSSQRYIMELMAVTPTAANVLEYAAIVRDRALLRNLSRAADEINTMVFEGAGEAESMLEAAERKIYALRKDRTIGGLMPVSAVVQNVYSHLSEVAASGVSIPGLATGLADLDRTILGLSGVNWFSLPRAPAWGKTSIALISLFTSARRRRRPWQCFLWKWRVNSCDKAFGRRGAGEQPEPPDGKTEPGRVAPRDERRRGDQRNGYPDRRQPHPQRLGYETPSAGGSGISALW
jgi:replicative DNA helicase